jgi:hypothetical protein
MTIAEPRSERVSVRVTPQGKEAIRTMARAAGLPESEIARQLLAYGLQRMPPPRPKENTL